MPRFYFHIYDEVDLLDEEGIEMADAPTARAAAMAGARAMICDEVKKGHLDLRHRIEVEDESGGAVLTLTFGDAVVIEKEAA